jgi:hypothetical protein
MLKNNRNERAVVTYKELIALAHQRGLVGVTTELLQIPDEKNGCVCIFKAVVQMDQGGVLKTYMGTGDASPANIRSEMVPHLIRLAETRAIARALRIAVNVGECSDAELYDYDENRTSKAPSARRPVADPDGPMTDIQRAAIESLARQRRESAPQMEGWTSAQAGEEIRRLQEKAA